MVGGFTPLHPYDKMNLVRSDTEFVQRFASHAAATLRDESGLAGLRVVMGF